MSDAVCFKCGAEKAGALIACQSCGATPEGTSELALSLVLSELMCSKRQLVTFAHDISNHLALSVSETLLGQAREALKDPQLLAMLGSSLRKSRPPSDAQPEPSAAAPALGSSEVLSQRSLQITPLHRNPFALLDVTTRDDRRRIVEVAEEKSLELDHDACQKARSDLTNPRTRLSAEMAWLPGISPRKASQLVAVLLNHPMSIREETGLPTLAHLNLMAAAFEVVDDNDAVQDVAAFIMEMALLVDELSPDEVLKDINEDRVVSGFPEVKGLDQVEAEFSERKRYYRKAIKDALDRLPTDSLVETMTVAVDEVTCNGELHAPELIDELVDNYAVEVQGFLQKEAENVERLIKATRDSAKSGELAVKPYVDKLEVVAKNWDRVAQPIQLSAKARGIDHEPSNEIAYAIRSLAIDLFNEHDMITQSQRITALIQELFAELPEVSERVEQDSEALANIFHERKESKAQELEWAREITYRAEVGVIFKDALSISPEGLTWKNQHYPLDAVSRVRWGAVRHSVNGVPSGTNYTLAFGDNRSEVVVELKKEATFSTFVAKLWRAVGVRLLTELLQTLESGNSVHFGEATIRDDGITLIKHKLFGSNEPIRSSWDDVHVWSADGAFYIGAKGDKKTYVSLSYIHSANTHVLEQAIRMAFKKEGMLKLSDLLQ